MPKFMYHIRQWMKYCSLHLFNKFPGPDTMFYFTDTLNNARRSVLWLSPFYGWGSWGSERQYLLYSVLTKITGHDFPKCFQASDLFWAITFHEVPEKTQWIHGIYRIHVCYSETQTRTGLLTGLPNASDVYAQRN